MTVRSFLHSPAKIKILLQRAFPLTDGFRFLGIAGQQETQVSLEGLQDERSRSFQNSLPDRDVLDHGDSGRVRTDVSDGYHLQRDQWGGSHRRAGARYGREFLWHNAVWRDVRSRHGFPADSGWGASDSVQL